jgi:hypothetical protein
MTRSADLADRSTYAPALQSLSSRPIPLYLVSVDRLVHVPLKGHQFSSRSLIFYIVNQPVRLAGTSRYKLESHVCYAWRWHPIFASTLPSSVIEDDQLGVRRQIARAPVTATWRGFGDGVGATGTRGWGKNIEERRLGTTDFFSSVVWCCGQRRGRERWV